MGTAIAIGVPVLAVLGFFVWMFMKGRDSEKGSRAKDEADKRRQDDEIDQLPMDVDDALDLLRRRAAARGMPDDNSR